MSIPIVIELLPVIFQAIGIDPSTTASVVPIDADPLLNHGCHVVHLAVGIVVKHALCGVARVQVHECKVALVDREVQLLLLVLQSLLFSHHIPVVIVQVCL